MKTNVKRRSLYNSTRQLRRITKKKNGIRFGPEENERATKILTMLLPHIHAYTHTHVCVE